MEFNLMDMFAGGGLFNFSGLMSQIFSVLRIVGVFVVLAGAIYLYSRGKKSKGSRKQIGWWEEVNEALIPLNIDNAEEITIPGTHLKVFYVKAKDLWLPRFTRGITKDLFYVAITPDREIVNFSLKKLSKDREEAGLNYDHTDMRWAAENTKEFIKRNYRDKSTQWWQLYKDTISTVIHIVIHTVSISIFMYFLIKFTGRLEGVAGAVANAVEKINMCGSPGSGVVTG